MATLGRLAFSFGAPAAVLAMAASVAWLSTSRLDPTPGPSRPVLFAPTFDPTPSGPVERFEPAAPPPNLDERAPAWQAQARNALIPYSRAPALRPARFSAAADREAPAQALQCLTSAVYYEATGEPDAGKRAVAQVVINRWASRAFPKTICGVVDQGAPAPGCQFSFMCDGALARKPSPQAWREAEAIARAALSGYVEPSVGGATHYHADYVVPVWAATMLKLTKLGRHIFYRWPGAAAYLTPRPDQFVAAAASADASGVSGAASVAAPAHPSAGSPPPVLAAASSVSDPAPVSAPVAAPTPSPPTVPKPTPEPPRRPIPAPSLRFGPL
jgi:hypothetical protein